MKTAPPDAARRLRLGIVGAGRVGTTIARLALGAGHEVAVAGAGSAADLAMVGRFTMPGAVTTDARGAVAGADVVVIAVPLKRFRDLDPTLFAGHVVIDAMNLWEPLDGVVEGFSDAPVTTSEVVQQALPGARVVKTLNHIGYHELESDAMPAGDPNRRALAIASDFPDAAHMVATLVDSLGFDPVLAGRLAHARAFQPGTEIFDGRLGADAIRSALGQKAEPALTGAAS
jgi:predicted dinucleotide-binding enzyme